MPARLLSAALCLCLLAVSAARGQSPFDEFEEPSDADALPRREDTSGGAWFAGRQLRHFAAMGRHARTHAAAEAHGRAEHHVVAFDRVIDTAALRHRCPDVFSRLEGSLAARGRAGTVGTTLVTFAPAARIATCLADPAVPPARVTPLHSLDKLHGDLRARLQPGVLGDGDASSADGAPLRPWPVDDDAGRHVHPLHVLLHACDGAGADRFLSDVASILRRAGGNAVTFAADVRWQGESAPATDSIPQRIRHTAKLGVPKCAEAHVVLPVAVASATDALPPALLAGLAALPYVRRVEPAPRFTGQNNVATVTLQAEESRNRPIWAHGLTGEGQVVAVGDTGLDYDSCFFDDGNQTIATYPAANWQHRKVVSYLPCVLTSGEKELGDIPNAHGTHVAGSLAGNAQHVPGTSTTEATVHSRTQYNGMAKDAKLFVNDFTCGKRALDNSMVLPGDMYEGYAPGYAMGARVSSFSWGDAGAPREYNAILRRTDAFVYENPDMTLVFAAGNGGLRDGVISPAAAKAVLTVGAHPNKLQSSLRDHVCSFSAQGETFDKRVKPDLLAPGQSIMSSRSDGSLTSHQCELQSNFGTSMACPLVAGSAVLLRQYFTDGFYPHGFRNASTAWPTVWASTIKAGLIHASHRFAHAQSAPEATEGFGRLELADAMFVSDAAAGRRRHVEYVETSGLRHRTRKDWCLRTSADSRSAVTDLRVTLVWTDPPFAAEGSHESVVNDLDLLVTRGSDGAPFRGNQDTTSPAAPNRTAFDRRNVVERVVLLAPAPNTVITVSVYAEHVVQREGQNFSLVMSAPGLEVSEGACPTSPAAKCPTFEDASGSRTVACSGHGACLNGQCRCMAGFRHVDCSECDGDQLCSGNGVCSPWTQQCACGPNADAAAAANCSVCKSGRFGPHCGTDCRCSHGTCNKTAGECVCDAGPAVGHWAGEHCDQCAFDFIRTAVDATGASRAAPDAAHCTVPATWCTHRRTREIVVPRGGLRYFVINDDSHYANSLTCKYLLRSADPAVRVRVAVTSFQLEEGFDTLSIYDGGDLSGVTDGLNRVQFATGEAPPPNTTAKANRSLLVHFESDFANAGEYKGFIGIAWAPRCDDTMCHGHGACGSPDADACTCEANFDPATGCTTCLAGFSGPDCGTGDATVAATHAPGATSGAPAATTTGAPTTAAPVPTTPRHCGAAEGEQACNGHGTCQTDGRCSCTPPYAGDRCELQCPSTGTTCSGAGECLPNATCACESGHTGVACQMPEGLLLQLRPAESVRRFVTATTAAPWRYVRYVTATEQPLPFPSRQLIVAELRVSWRIPRRAAATAAADPNAPVPDATTEAPVTAQPTYPPPGAPDSPFLAAPAWSIAIWNDAAHAGIAGREVATADYAAGTSGGCVAVVGWNRDYRQSTTVGLHMELPSAVASAAEDAYPIVTIREFIDHNATAALAGCPRGRVCVVEPACVDDGSPHAGVSAQYELVEVDRTVHRQTAEELLSNNKVVLPLVAAAFVIACLATTAIKLGYSGWKTRRYATLEPADGDADADADGVTPTSGRPVSRRAALARATTGGGSAGATTPQSYGDSVIEMRPRAYIPTPQGGGASPDMRGAGDAGPAATPAAAGRADADERPPDDDDDDDEALIGEAHAAASQPAVASPGGFAPGSHVPDFSV